MKNTSLTRSTSYWLLLVLSLASAAVGGWLVWDSTTTMLTTILDGTATNVEVYVGQAWVTSGAALLAAGILGIFLTLFLGAAKALIPAAPVVVEPLDDTTDASDASTPEGVEGSPIDATTEQKEKTPEIVEESVTETDPELVDQNGNSGSTATATNSSVR
ncbi:MAG TPA: hypothetical protein DIW46_02505 [Microbacterium sp.]|uniref:hypothetical protein n=1 Tax=Microbacterium sp. TaxID=51671 RepID=UPI000EC7DD9C|nr:hypothetical protein [Microbacterium sp.]